MKVALCCIGRLENRYAVEFVEYYKQLGVDHIFIADNNHDDEEHFEDVLQSYIDDNFVTIYNYRNVINCQCYIYNVFYEKFYKYFDYIVFCDFDEFIILVKDNNIKEYLLRNINNYNVIQLNWMIYTDNNLIFDDGRSCLERFTEPMDLYKTVSYEGKPENFHTKCIIKCVFEKIEFNNNPHIIKLTNKHKVCNGSFIDKQNNNNDTWAEYNKDGTIDYSLAYIKHFTFKTIDEYVNKLFKRGTIEGGINDMLNRYKYHFFKVNEKTNDKIKYCLEHNIDPNIL